MEKSGFGLNYGNKREGSGKYIEKCKKLVTNNEKSPYIF